MNMNNEINWPLNKEQRVSNSYSTGFSIEIYDFFMGIVNGA